MPDVGVLQLQIHDDSEKAAQGLKNLASALERVRNAVNIGRQLGTIATNLNRLATVVNQSFQSATIAKIEQMAAALEKMQNVGRVNIRISYGKENEFAAVARAYEAVQNSANGILDATRSLETEYINVNRRVEEVVSSNESFQRGMEQTNSIMQQTSWQAGEMEKVLLRAYAAWNNLRMSRSLGAGQAAAGYIGEGYGNTDETGWTYYNPFGETPVTSWEEWKNGAIEVEGTVTDAFDGIRLSAGNVFGYLTSGMEQTAQAADTATGSMQRFNAATGEYTSYNPMEGVAERNQELLYRLSHGFEQILKAFEHSSEGIQRAVAQMYGFDPSLFQTFRQRMTDTANAVMEVQQATAGTGTQASLEENRQFVDNLVEGYDKVELMTMRLNEMKDALAGDITMNKLSTQQIAERSMRIQDLAHKIEELKAAQEALSDSAGSTGGAFDGLRDGLARMFPTLTQLLNRFKSIAKYRFIRAIIQQITKGINEGLQNVYFYSKAVGTSFAPAMDSAASALQQMKNSIGAALAPVMEALIPVLQTIVSWFINVINYVNQFFSLMNGQKSWTKALATSVDAYTDSTKKAKKATNALKELLADWDELNIIQSQTGGNGTGIGTDAENYELMFEQVHKYEGWIQKLADGIKEQFGDIWNLVGKIALGILGWKVAGAFSGVLGTLGSLLAAGALIDIVFNVTTMFDNNYLETGEKGWLVADFLTTLIGATLMKKVLTKILGGGAAQLAIPIIFTVSAAASIIANVEHTDVGALSEESLNTSLLAALEGSVAAGYLAYFAGGTIGAGIGGGAVGLLTTFGIAIGLKADAQIIADDITPENVYAKLLSIGSLGLGGALAGGLLGGGAAGAAGMAMLFGGAPIVTFGAAVAINAINDVVDGHEITADVVKKNFLAGGLIGSGLAIGTFAVAGGTLAGIVGIGAAALVVGALFAIEAFIASDPAKVEWGNYNATKEEIEAFVEEELLKYPPEVTISTINATVEPLGESKTRLEEDVGNMIGTLYAAKLGVKTNVEDLKGQVDQLIADFNNASQQYQNTLQVALSLAPVQDSEGNDQSAGMLKRSDQRWSALNSIMTDLGTDLADAYKIAYDARLKGNIDEAAEQTIKEISDMMTRVATAISNGQARAKAGNAIRLQMENLSRETLDGVLDTYKQQRDELIKELTKIRQESAEGILAQQYAFEELAAYALKDAGGNTEDETYKYYMRLAGEAKADYEALLASLQHDVEKAADNFADEETMEALRTFMLNSIKNMLNDNDVESALESAGYGDVSILSEYIAKTLQKAVATGDTTESKEEIQDIFDELLTDLVGEENFETYKKAIESNVLGYGDLFSETFLENLKETLGISGQSQEVQELWNTLVAGIFKKDVVKNETKEAAKGTVKQVESAVNEAFQDADFSDVNIDQKITDALEAKNWQNLSMEELKSVVGQLGDLYGMDEVERVLREAFDIPENDLAYLTGKLEDEKPTAPPIDLTNFTGSLTDMENATRTTVENIQGLLGSLNSSWSIDTSVFGNKDMKVVTGKLSVARFATGGFPTSGSLFMADENGNIEMKGQMGNQPVVANNQQIVDGISAGVSNANEEVVSELRSIATAIQRILTKEFTAKVVPSAAMGRSNQLSSEAYSRVTG